MITFRSGVLFLATFHSIMSLDTTLFGSKVVTSSDVDGHVAEALVLWPHFVSQLSGYSTDALAACHQHYFNSRL